MKRMKIKQHYLLLPYQEKKGFTILKTLSKELRRTLPEKTLSRYKIGISIQHQRSCSKNHNHDIIYHTVCQGGNSNEDYTGKCAVRLEERTKDRNGREKKPHITSLNRTSIKTKFQNQTIWKGKLEIEKGSSYHAQKWKISEPLFIKNKEPSSSKKDKISPSAII